MGDSITHMAFQRDLSPDLLFEGRVNQGHPEFYPAVINGGIGGKTAAYGASHVGEWLALNPDSSHIAVADGTNGAWGNKDPANLNFESSLDTIVTEILADDRVPILASIPFATAAHETVAEFNDVIDRVRRKHGLPSGPDLYTWFSDHPDELKDDGVHPRPAGNRNINQLWAEAVDHLYPAE